MKKHIIFFIGIFATLSVSRFIPHPPNFTSLIALSFYVPALLGMKYIPHLMISFAITDFIIGYHTGTHWTWGSVFLISLMSGLFLKSKVTRIIGALSGALIFFIITNFGVWLSGIYTLSLKGLIECYFLAIPFFVNTLISTLIFSFLIELVYTQLKSNKSLNKIHIFK